MASKSIVAMKQELCEVFPGYKWEQRVNKMKDGQIVALYMKLVVKREKKDDKS